MTIMGPGDDLFLRLAVGADEGSNVGFQEEDLTEEREKEMMRSL